MNPKVINSLSARLARIEALLENNDVFKASSGATYGGLNYQGSVFNIEAPGLEQPPGFGFGNGGDFGGMAIDPSDMTIFDLRQRIAALELMVSGGSNDTFQGEALDAGAAVGDDGERGSGDSSLSPEEISEDLDLGTMAYQAANAVAITGGTAVLSSATISGGSITGITDLAIADGGTGASSATDARTNLGLGSIATQAASNVSITGGSVTGITDLAIADGGTGASTAANARSNLGVGTMGTQNSNNVAITGGAVNGTTIGSTSRSTAQFTTINANGTITVEDSAGDDHVTISAATDGGVVNLYNDAGVVRGTVYIASDDSLRIESSSTTALRLYTANDIHIAADTELYIDSGLMGFFGVAPVTKPTVSGSRGGNAALASLCTALANLGLITDSTT